MTPLDETLDQLDADIVHVGQFDYSSVFRERRLRREQFLKWAKRPSFANVIPHWDSRDQLVSGGPFRSEALHLDHSSLRRFAFEERSACIIGEYTGPSNELMPRAVLRNQLSRAKKLGLHIEAAFEFEFIVLDETAKSLRDRGFAAPRQFAPANKCWDGATAAQFASFVTDLERVVLDSDIALFGVAGELGPGCFEATLDAVDALRAADDASFFRLAAHAFARQNDLTITFMPSLGPGYPGLGGHVNFSIWDAPGGRNFLSSQDNTTNDFARSLVGGIIRLTPPGFALCAHTVNAYRRYAPGTWAPKSVTWSEWAYTTAIRSAPSPGNDARLEFRLPGADCNPYLTMALIIAGCLDGYEQQLKAPDPNLGSDPDQIPEGAAPLPGNLGQAADVLSESVEMRDRFGSGWIEHFVNYCRKEHAQLARSVSPDELARYLEN